MSLGMLSSLQTVMGQHLGHMSSLGTCLCVTVILAVDTAQRCNGSV